jgi:hypothetical protein
MTSFNEFWQWLNPDNEVFEIRIRDWKVIKECGQRFRLPYYSGGVFVKSFEEVVKVIKNYRGLTTMWLGVNPRKKCFDRGGVERFGGKDEAVYSISHIFLDIDRIDGEGVATAEEKEKIKKFVDIIIDDLKNLGVTNFARIDSGNGEQLLIKLDEAIVLPAKRFDWKLKNYEFSEEFEKYKNLVKKTFVEGTIKKYNTAKNQKLYGCRIDKSCGNIGRVCALPGSFNHKHGERVLRRVISLGQGKNEGLADSLLKEFESLTLPVYNKGGLSKPLAKEFKYKPKDIILSPLAKLLLRRELPNGDRNSHLIFQLKCLCKDNNIPLNCSEIQTLFKLIEVVQRDKYPLNEVNGGHFNPNVVNNYCLEHGINLVYEAWWDKPKKREFDEHIFCWNNFKVLEWKPLELSGGIGERLYKFREGFDGEIEQIYGFIAQLEKERGVGFTKHFLEQSFKQFLEKMG